MADEPPPPPVLARVSPPRGWPESFDRPEMQQFIQTELKGQRVRLIGRPGPADEVKIRRLRLKTEDSLAIAQQAKAELGWAVVAGYALYELEDPPEGGCRYTSEVHFWNAKPSKEGTPGKWVDGSPSAHRDVVLVESWGVRIPPAPKPVVQEPLAKRLYANADLWYLDERRHGHKSAFQRVDAGQARRREAQAVREHEELAQAIGHTLGGNLWRDHNRHAPPPPKPAGL